MDKVKNKRYFYLVRNGFKQPLYREDNGQMHLYMTKEDAQNRVKKTKIIDKATGRKREIVKVTIEEII